MMEKVMTYDELAQMKMALRYIYENGFEHSSKMPTWVNQCFDKAWKPVRAGRSSRDYPPHDMQLPN